MSLESTGVVRFRSNQSHANALGSRVASAGDVNGDGYDDLIFGVEEADNGSLNRAGAVYIVYGQADDLASQNLGNALISGLAVPLFGLTAYGHLGNSVAGVGDVNNDGYDDVLIGAKLERVDDHDNAGAAYLIYGQAQPLTSTALNSAIQFSGDAIMSNVGSLVCQAGDVNGDGYDDMLITAYHDPVGSEKEIRRNIYLIYGQAEPLVSQHLRGNVAFHRKHLTNDITSCDTAGDVNNDGYDDILIGTPYHRSSNPHSGAAYLIYGQAERLRSGNLKTFIKFSGEHSENFAGAAVASAGDVNNDGYDDILIGAPGDSNAEDQRGKVYLIYGTKRKLTSRNLRTAIRFTAETIGDASGVTLARSDDLNQDGYDDWLIGASEYDNIKKDVGAVYIVYGQAKRFTNQSLTTQDKYLGTTRFTHLGYGVSAAGDVNGDSYPDILLGGLDLAYLVY